MIVRRAALTFGSLPSPARERVTEFSFMSLTLIQIAGARRGRLAQNDDQSAAAIPRCPERNSLIIFATSIGLSSNAIRACSPQCPATCRTTPSCRNRVSRSRRPTKLRPRGIPSSNSGLTVSQPSTVFSLFRHTCNTSVPMRRVQRSCKEHHGAYQAANVFRAPVGRPLQDDSISFVDRRGRGAELPCQGREPRASSCARPALHRAYRSSRRQIVVRAGNEWGFGEGPSIGSRSMVESFGLVANGGSFAPEYADPERSFSVFATEFPMHGSVD